MDLVRFIITIINLSFSIITIILAIIFLVVIIVLYYQNHLNFFTVLTCNTCIATLIFVINTLFITIYMMILDQSEIKVKTDFLCIVRGYINYTGIDAIYHSYVLQALYRY